MAETEKLEDEEKKGEDSQEDLVVPVEDEDLEKRTEDKEEVDDDDLDDLDEEEEESRLGAGEPEVDEAKRERRRLERKESRKRRREGRERDTREMRFLRDRNETLERRFSEVETRVAATEHSTVDQRINHVKGQIKLADQVIAQAVTQGNGEDLVEAQGIRDNLRDHLTQLDAVKQTIAAGEGGEEDQGPDPTLMKYANQFVTKHDWWDPKGGDEDSLIVSAIDNALALESYDPGTKEYWDELGKRVQARLPHRFETKGNGKDEGDDKEEGDGGKPKRTPSGPTFSTGGRERPLNRNEVYVSPDRKEAMVEAGIWDDPEQRQRYLKQYQKYDAEHAGEQT